MRALSDRLHVIASMVEPSGIVADVGCDHAFLSICLLEQGRAEHIYAMDINPGPLKSAQTNAYNSGLEDKMDFILSDGLKKMPRPFPERVVITGMGGRLILNILAGAPEGLIDSVDEFILGPQSEVEFFRREIKGTGLVITQEKHLSERGKFYTLMKARAYSSFPDRAEAESLCPVSDPEYIYGVYGLKRADPALKARIEKDREVISGILDGKVPEDRRVELCKLLWAAEDALKNYYEDP